MSENNENQAPRRGIAPRPTPTGPRLGRIGDWNNNPSSSSGGSSSGRFATLGGGGGRSSRHHDDDDDDKKEESWFAGGERSGLSIQGPATSGNRPDDDPMQSILRQARRNAESRRQVEPTSSAFSGGGYRLGDETTESSFVPDPNAPQGEVVTRTVTIYANGILIEGGSFIASNTQEARMIANGTAPKALFGVEDDQDVDVNVIPKLTEEYSPPAGAIAFSGTGNRLGAPVPEASSSSDGAMPGQFPSSSAPTPAAEPQSVSTRFEVDQSLPTTSVQIRLADGTRIVSRMNLTHTVGDIRNFINASRPENRTRPYTVGTTFPNRILDNDAATIEAEKLQNSVVVQRWV